MTPAYSKRTQVVRSWILGIKPEVNSKDPTPSRPPSSRNRLRQQLTPAATPMFNRFESQTTLRP